MPSSFSPRLTYLNARPISPRNLPTDVQVTFEVNHCVVHEVLQIEDRGIWNSERLDVDGCALGGFGSDGVVGGLDGEDAVQPSSSARRISLRGDLLLEEVREARRRRELTEEEEGDKSDGGREHEGKMSVGGGIYSEEKEGEGGRRGKEGRKRLAVGGERRGKKKEEPRFRPRLPSRAGDLPEAVRRMIQVRSRGEELKKIPILRRSWRRCECDCARGENRGRRVSSF